MKTPVKTLLSPYSVYGGGKNPSVCFVDPDVHVSFDTVGEDGIVIGRGLNATLVGAPTWCPDSPSGGAIYLNGIDQYVDLGHSMDCWAKPEYCACGHTMALWVKFGPDDVEPNTHRLVLSSGGSHLKFEPYLEVLYPL